MSYDVNLIDKDGEEVYWSNMTSNVSKMWYDHFPDGGGLKSLDGMKWKEAKPEFKAFWISLSNERYALCDDKAVGDPLFCAKYDVDNGWGSAIGAMLFIAKLQSAWALNPKAKLSVSC